MSAPDPRPPPPPPPAPTPPPLLRSNAPDRETALELYRWMATSRALELRVVELYRQNRVTGGCYTGVGNEATSVGCALAMAPQDVLVPTHRDMGAHLVRGHAVVDILRQYMKRSTAQTEGKDSSLHLGQEGSNIVGMISHLAHMMPVAVGVALAERQKQRAGQGQGACVMTTVGDGSTSLGDFHEALNFAAVQQLPVLFVIENNQYAYSTPTSIQYACDALADRAGGYGMPGRKLDGTDPFEVWQAARTAYARGRAGEGPTLLECVTMRMRGHSEHDDFKYVPAELLEAWGRWDPILRLRGFVLDEGWADEAWLERTDVAIAAQIDAAIEVAEAEPPPDPSAAGQDVYRNWREGWTSPSGEVWEPVP